MDVDSTVAFLRTTQRFRTTSHGNHACWLLLPVLDCLSLDQLTKKKFPWLFSPRSSVVSLQYGVQCPLLQHHHHHHRRLPPQLLFSLSHASSHPQQDSDHPRLLPNVDQRQCPVCPLLLLQQLRQNLQPSQHSNPQTQLSAFWTVFGRSRSMTRIQRKVLAPSLLPRSPRS